jgi:long-chain acyl-CoA synthetase
MKKKVHSFAMGQTESNRLIPGGPQGVADVLEAMLAENPKAEALVSATRRLSYADLDREVTKAANAMLRLGIGPGDRVAACLPNECDIVIAFLATMRIGAIWVGIGQILAPPEKVHLLGDAEPTAMLADQSTWEEIGRLLDDRPEIRLRRLLVGNGEATVEPWIDLVAAASGDPVEKAIDPFAPAAIAYTSGTTGLPKGAVHSQHNIALVCVGQREVGRFRMYSRQGVVLPLTLLNMQICGPVAAFVTKSCSVIMGRPRPLEIAEWVRTERLMTFGAVPTMIQDLLTDPGVTDRDLETLSEPWVGGSEPSEEFRRVYEERFGFAPATAYGLTEGPNGVATEINGESHKPGSSGRAYPTMKIHVLDDEGREVPTGEQGEICIGPATEGPWAGIYTPMLGYWRQPEASAEVLAGGLLHSGDLGHLDEDGHLFITGRKKELILRGGSNVYPAEVERTLAEHPAVRQCAVLGLPSERLGERVGAAIELEAGAAPDAEEMIEFCRGRLAAYKVPQAIAFVDAMPLTAMGKIRKLDLIPAFTAEKSAQAG